MKKENFSFYSESPERDAMDIALSSLIIKRYHEWIKNNLHGYRFTPNEISSMIYLLIDPETDTAKDISTKYGTTQSLICRSVDSLSEKGYLQITNDETDRRVNHLSLNIEDDELRKKLLSLNKEFIEMLMANVPAEDVQVFQSVLQRIEENIK